MKKHLTSEDLSAYMDGEYSRPADAQKHLQQCADCAHKHVAMQKLSAHVRSLPEPEVTIGFQARVMRAIEQPVPVRRNWASRYWMPIGAGLAATLAVMVGVVYTPESQAPTVESASGMSRETTTAIDLAGALGPDGSERDVLGGDPGVVGDMQIALADAAASRPVPSEFFRSADYNASIVALDAREKETLFQLLGSSVIDEHMM